MKYAVYILRCRDASLYVGYTIDLKRRLAQHNSTKRGARYTKVRRPVTLAHAEQYRTLSEALKREHEIKSWRRKKKIELISGKNTY